MNCPSALRDFRITQTQLSRPAVARRRFRTPASLRARRRRARPRARAFSFCQDDAHIFCTVEQVASEDGELHQDALRGVQNLRLREGRREARYASRQANRLRRVLGPRRKRARRRTPKKQNLPNSKFWKGRGLFTGQKWNFTCRMHSNAAGSSAPSSTTRTCRSVSISSTRAATARRIGRSCSIARCSDHSNDSSPFFSSTAAEIFRRGSRPSK